MTAPVRGHPALSGPSLRPVRGVLSSGLAVEVTPVCPSAWPPRPARRPPVRATALPPQPAAPPAPEPRTYPVRWEDTGTRYCAMCRATVTTERLCATHAELMGVRRGS